MQGVEYCSSNDVVPLTLFIFVVVFLTKVMKLNSTKANDDSCVQRKNDNII